MELVHACCFAVHLHKTTKDYHILFEMMKIVCGLQIEVVMADFELAIRGGLLLAFPTINIRGCSFHLMSAIRKWCVNNGFASLWADEIKNTLENFVESEEDPTVKITGLKFIYQLNYNN